MNNPAPRTEVPALFASGTPEQTWETATEIIRLINPSYDCSVVYAAFTDIVRLFRGEYPGYCAIKTPYHDLPHTQDVFLCSARLLHGVHVSGEHVDDETITLLCIAALMHDIGYAQRIEEEHGTGAQYTQSHIERGIAFMRHYLAEHGLPAEWDEPLSCIVRSTSFDRTFQKISFPDQRSRLTGQILGSADLLAQMADRIYLEKLMLLYLEFREAQFGDYRSMYDLLCRTRDFYEYTLIKLDEDFGGIHTRLSDHFEVTLGVKKNYYIESIEKNLDYLSQVTALDEDHYQSMLRRHGIMEKFSHLLAITE